MHRALQCLILSCAFSVYGITGSAAEDATPIEKARGSIVQSHTADDVDVITGRGTDTTKPDETIACAGVYAPCEAILIGEPHMAVIHAQNVRHCWDLANRCKRNVDRVTYFGGQSVVICAPLSVCHAN